ncbi:putative tyrosine-protein kinase, partial [Apostichopus japonicus]
MICALNQVTSALIQVICALNQVTSLLSQMICALNQVTSALIQVICALNQVTSALIQVICALNQVTSLLSQLICALNQVTSVLSQVTVCTCHMIIEIFQLNKHEMGEVCSNCGLTSLCQVSLLILLGSVIFLSSKLLFNRMLLMLSNLQQRCLCLQPSSNKDVPLEDEAWYHGALPRQETEELLKQEGDFIFRFKSDASGQYVLSCRSADKQRHFPIVKQDDSTYRLEGGSFRSIQELVNHHMSTQTPVTKASNAMIRNPISKVKDEHDLRHKDILLDTKLGQ